MLRVLHCVNLMNRGGIETLLMNIYKNLDRSKVQFDFLVLQPGEGEYDQEITRLGGKIYNVRSRREGIRKNINDLDNFFENHRYEIVHVHVSSLTNIQAIKSAYKKKVPNRIIHCHNTKGPKGILHELTHKYNQTMIDKYCTDKFACSIDAAEWGFGFKKRLDEVTIFNNAIDTSQFSYNQKVRREIREQLNLDGKFVVGHIGRFVEQKNHEFIVNVFDELKKTKVNAVLLLVGVGKLRKQIENKVKELGIEESVLFLGSRSDVNNLMQAMDVFLFPSLFEGLGIVAIEAQTCGLPVLASDVVPNEAALTDIFYSLDLGLHPKIWAEKIKEIFNQGNRISRHKEIADKGYDIKANAEWITTYYLENIKK